MPTQTTTVTGQQAIPTELMPYFTGTGGVAGLLPKAQEIFSKSYETQFGTPLAQAGLTAGQRIAPLSSMQQQVGQQLSEMATPTQFGMGQAAAQQAQQMYQSPFYTRSSPLQQYAMQPVQQVMAPGVTTYGMQGPQNVNVNPLTTFQMGGPERVGLGSAVYGPSLQQFQMAAPGVFGSDVAQQYMSPYQQMVTDVAKQEAVRDYQKGQVGANLAAARQGTYGGARNILAQTEAQRNLQTQLQGIQSRGLQEAFTNAQTQYERDRAAAMAAGQQNLQALLGVQQLGAGQSVEAQKANQAAIQQALLANQQAGLTTSQQNLAAALGVQQLGTQTGLQAALANQAAQQATQQQNLQAQQAAEQLRAQQNLQAQLANQQMGYNVGQQNLQALLGVQQLGSAQSLEAQKANLAAQMQAAQGLGTLGDVMTRAGTAQQASDIDRLKTMGAYGDLQRAIAQQQIDTRYQDFLKQIGYPAEQLGNMADILRGVPITKLGETTTTTTPPPSFASQLAGLGLSGLSLYNLLK